MTPDRREQMRREARAAWARKTPEEQLASLKRFYDEIVQKGVKGIREAFAEARRQACEEAESRRVAEEARGTGP